MDILHRGELVAAILRNRSLVEEEDHHMKLSFGCSEMGFSAHLHSSKAGNTRIFTSNTHSSVVLQGFDQLRLDGLLCDVTLMPGDTDDAYPVHRVMMASASDYFKAMFTGGMKEQELMCIKLHGVSKVGLRKIIDFIYTAKLSLNMDTLQDTLEAASFLQILPVLDFCKVFLISGVNLDNCVEVGRIANTYHLTEVDKYVNTFVLKNFSALLSTGEFLKLPFERLSFALSSNSLKHCSELELFKATCRWLRLEEPRMDCAPKLMKSIRFPLMTPQELINYVQTVDFMRTDNTCVNLLLEASNYQMMPFMQPVMQSDRTAIRSDTTHLVTLGGVLRQQLVVSKELRMYDEKTQEWKSLAPMDAPRYQHGIAVIGNFLYVVGGQSNYDTKGKTAVDTVFRFDPRYNKWIQVASLNEKRTFFHLSALKGFLYAVGGRNAAGELPTVECYNPRTNEWTYVAKMNEPHYGHAGTVYGGVMYISGGITHDTFQKELMCFDPDTDKWTQKAPMTTVRGLHCMCTVGDRLYVIGGNHFRGTSDYDDVLSCEYYSPILDQWTPIAAMLRGQSDVGVAVFQNKIYVVGGYSWNNRCMVEIVQKYDPEKDEWHKVFDLPESLGGIRACTLTVFPPEETTPSPSRESPLSAP
ncbi:kelch-like protein 13 isoform X4 [Alexandromys fortis]|uniref:kelch-like protein 13 isoform X4 n=1 Tax=Alexandromys fortis TaxID=100897 RepID=UPI00215371DA|nr:kelch-like protein 13 isoform X4 [Microtus fortis]XP_049977896.1 kelch-like protein 13 isoform X4 [Microtus fortis]